ncbi:hypothetical protein [Legionella spiritensis]|uniref:hypothetical protein n=1 Tax=Legionella spiritensis TaxID=452 RepID=UPI000F6CF965|nr:hypothetical protein [Legionella spiritensis]VEG92507.1 Uncharacterised protein [Legionella spiritensis]
MKKSKFSDSHIMSIIKQIEETNSVFLVDKIKKLAKAYPESCEELYKVFRDKHGLEKIIKSANGLEPAIEMKALVKTFPKHQKDLLQVFLDDEHGLDKIIDSSQLADVMEILAKAFPEHQKDLLQAFVVKQGLEKIIQGEVDFWLDVKMKKLAQAFPDYKEYFNLSPNDIERALLSAFKKEEIEKRSTFIKSLVTEQSNPTFFAILPRELCKDVAKFTCYIQPEIVTEGDIAQAFTSGFDK